MTFGVVLAGGDVPDRRVLAGLEDAEVIVAADGGVRIARTHGLPIHALVGDLDSASEGDIAWAKLEGAEIIEYPEDKDSTDLELALQHADDLGFERLVVAGISGGRLDHELGNWSALCAPRKSRVEVLTNTGWASVLHGPASLQLSGSKGDVVSLLPRHGDAFGVTTWDLRWPLEEATLTAATTWGMSNEMLGDVAEVEVRSGVLLVIRPDVRSG